MNENLQNLQESIILHAVKIEKLFKDKVNVTICVRNLEREKANVVISSETSLEVVLSEQFLRTLNEQIPKLCEPSPSQARVENTRAPK